mgnify:CR=1 FL=1
MKKLLLIPFIFASIVHSQTSDSLQFISKAPNAKPLFQIKYAPHFADNFVLDGRAQEFEAYRAYQIEPDTVAGADTVNWTPESADLYFKTVMTIDDDYLYIFADVTDDDTRGVGDIYEPWQGDALEIYLGFYDLDQLEGRTRKTFASEDGDWRIGFLPNGTTSLDGWLITDVPGVDAAAFPKFSNDGYIVEARFALDSLVADGQNFVVYDGLRMPLKIDCTDQDPNLNGDTERTLIAVAGTIPEEKDKMRPYAWGVAEIIGAPPPLPGHKNRLPDKTAARDDSPPKPFVPSAEPFVTLDDALASAKALLKSTKQGKSEGKFPSSAKAKLRAALNNAISFKKATPSLAQADSVIFELYRACSIYESQVSMDSVSIVDRAANKQTRYLFLNLKNQMNRSFLYGMQHAAGYGVGWTNDDNRGDVKDVCGDFPAIHGEDLHNVIRNIEVDRIRGRIVSAYERGAVITVAWHQSDPDMRSFYTADLNGEKIVEQILPGGSRHSDYLKKLKTAALFFQSLRGKKGEAIPIIFRPYHEHLGSWFWWGVGHCSTEEYNRLWRFTVSHLRDSLQVHNLLWAISPSIKYLNSGDDYFKRYPGNDYVDIFGADFYYNTPISDQVVADYRRRLNQVVRVALKNDKIPALTEIGQEGLDDVNWHTRTMLEPIKHDSVNNFIAYGVTWRNANASHFHAPYPGHASVPDFLDFYNDPYTLFERDLPKMYAPPKPDRRGPKLSSPLGGRFVVAQTPTQIALESDESAELRWSYRNQDFDRMENAFETGGSGFSHMATINAKQGETRTVFVRAKDELGNKTKRSFAISFTVDTLQTKVSWTEQDYPIKDWQMFRARFRDVHGSAGQPLTTKTAYFVKDFELNALPNAARFILQYNGGIAVYINGDEIFRHNLPGGMALKHDTPPRTTRGMARAIPLPSETLEKLRSGKNRVAIEIHGGAEDVQFFDAMFQTDKETAIEYGAEWAHFAHDNQPPVLRVSDIVQTKN